MTLRVLRQDEKERSRSLYELCFPEDTKHFVDYYYREKCRDNRILVTEEQGRIISMVHENPFCISLCGHAVSISYIVAVATHPDYRRRGLMQSLMREMFAECASRREPFSFLMPANPAYYEPLGYRFWESQTQWSLPEPLGSCAELPKEPFEDGELAAFMNAVLEQSFDVFVRRDASYCARLRLEQESEDGGIAVWRDEAGRIGGCCSYSMEEGTFEVREPIFPAPRQLRSDLRPLMMGRIICLETFVQSLRFSEEYKETLCVTDPGIPENNGCFEIRINQQGGSLKRVSREENCENCEIAELGQRLFQRLRIFVNEVV